MSWPVPRSQAAPATAKSTGKGSVRVAHQVVQLAVQVPYAHRQSALSRQTPIQQDPTVMLADFEVTAHPY